jgi:hypothetical protein
LGILSRVGVHAFVDESVRDRLYLVSAALVAPTEVHHLCVAMRRLRMPGQCEARPSFVRTGAAPTASASAARICTRRRFASDSSGVSADGAIVEVCGWNS